MCVYCNPGVGWSCLLYCFIKHCNKPNGSRPQSPSTKGAPPTVHSLFTQVPHRRLTPCGAVTNHQCNFHRNQTTSISQPALFRWSVCFQMSAGWNISPNQWFNLLLGIYSTLLNILYYTELHGWESKSEFSPLFSRDIIIFPISWSYCFARVLMSSLSTGNYIASFLLRPPKQRALN